MGSRAVATTSNRFYLGDYVPIPRSISELRVRICQIARDVQVRCHSCSLIRPPCRVLFLARARSRKASAPWSFLPCSPTSRSLPLATTFLPRQSLASLHSWPQARLFQARCHLHRVQRLGRTAGIATQMTLAAETGTRQVMSQMATVLSHVATGTTRRRHWWHM